VFTPQHDGITELWALLPAEGAALIETVLNSLASGQTDDRSADQRRADALVEVFARVLADPSLPEQHGKRPAIQVSVPLRTLLGGDNQPAHPDGYGPITAALAHRLAADQSGTWRRLVTDDTSQLLDYGRKTYRPPANLTNHLIARDRACTFPGRRRAAKLCDLDHRGLDRRRRHKPREPRRPLRQTPQRQAPRRLASQTPTRRHQNLDQPDRTHLHQGT